MQNKKYLAGKLIYAETTIQLVEIELIVRYVQLNIFAAEIAIPDITTQARYEVWRRQQVENSVVQSVGGSCPAFMVRLHSGGTHGTLRLYFGGSENHHAKHCNKQYSSRAFHVSNLRINYLSRGIFIVKNDNKAIP
jgi:hypothetical protein